MDQAAGEMSDAEVFGGGEKEMTDDEVFGKSAPQLGTPTIADEVTGGVPAAFLDRVSAGQALTRIAKAAKQQAGESWDATPTGLSDEFLNHMIDLGVFHDPAKGRPGPLQFGVEALTVPTMQIGSFLQAGIKAGLGGVAGAYGQLVEEFGGSQGQASRARRDITGLGEMLMIEGGMGRFSRPTVEAGAVSDRPVGGLPTPQDFANAGKVLDSPHAEPNLRRMWQEEGIHPAEAVHDAASDAFVKNEITAPSITVYHGTPHDFDRFDIGKISTGEGTQAFGHGLYFTDEEAIAQDYRNKLSDKDFRGDFAQKALARNNGDAERAALDLRRQADGYAKYGETNTAKIAREAADLVESGWTKPDGRIYQAKINADPEKMLQWDKPLGEQPEGVKRVFAQQLEELGPQAKMKDLIESLSEQLPGGAKELSEKLSAEGVPGVKYLANESQGPGYNYVVFNDKDIEITHKNGQPVSTPPKDWSVPKEETDFVFGEGASLSAARTDPDVLAASLTKEPARPTGSLMASVKQASETLFDIGRDAQMLVAPMARGTRDSRAMVKDFANSLRRNRWDWARIDADIAKRFDPEARARMWTAADEESVSLQLGEPAHMREHQGLATLEPAERALVEEMQARAQNAWVRARDLGMVEGEGLPAYTPRMVMNIGTAFADDKALPLNSIGQNLKIRTAQMLRRKHMTVEETEAAAKEYVGMRAALKGMNKDEIEAAIDKVAVARDIRVLPMATAKLEDAIAGRSLINQIKSYGEGTGAETVVEGGIPSDAVAKYFTLDHPAFRTWRPRFKDGEIVKDAHGDVVFEQVPIYVHSDFEGPLRAVLQHKSGPLYQGLMALKGKTMSLIMNSPMIHNAVEWGRALPAMPGKVATFKVYFEGNRAKNNVPLMQEAINNGLVPIGHRFFNQDITSIMEAPDLTPGRSWTAKVLGAVPGLFDEAAGTAVKRAIDKAGDFYHNTLLWDRVADLQMGLYKNFLDDAVAKGIDRTTASRMAAHWANRYAGSLPKEAMSDAATKIANMLMFSRSFTMGNLGVLKDMFTGLPKDVLAQIERDGGFAPGAIAGADSSGAAAVSYAKSMARRKAMAVIAMDMGLFYVGNSILQNALNVMFNDSTLDKELHGYAERMLNKLQEVKEHPLQLAQPLRLLEDVSATSENEPGRQDRLRVGFAKDGTAIYARNPAGKIGEEFLGYMTGPLDMMRKKLGTIARPAWQIMSNDAGFGRKVYDPNADTPGKYLLNLGRIAAHLAGSQLPVGQLGAFHDLVTGEGDAKVNSAQAFGPFIGVTFSKGAPGGPAVGEMYAARTQHDFAVQNALPDIRRQIQRGDLDGAMDRMTQLGIPAGLQRFYVRTTLNPATRMSSKAVRDFYLYASPEQRARFERAQRPSVAP